MKKLLILTTLFSLGACTTSHDCSTCYSSQYVDDKPQPDILDPEHSRLVMEPAIAPKPLTSFPPSNQITPYPTNAAWGNYHPEGMWQARPHPHHTNYQLLGNYVSRLANNLLRNLPQYYYTAPIAVASFVNLDSTLETTNLAGNQIAEEFITEIRQLGLPVVDFKVTGVIKVTDTGDYVLSRKAHQLRKQMGINNVLTGTMIWHESGLAINARIVNLENNTVLAAAKSYIPYFVADQIFTGPHEYRFHGYSGHY